MLKRLALIASCIFAAQTAQANPEHVYTDAELLAMAGNPYANGELPLGDRHYVTDGPKKGYIYLCHLMQANEGGAFREGDWIHGSTWNILQKIVVHGDVQWSNARFNAIVSGNQRILSGNGLPVNHGTGIFPVQSNDPAAAYDRNPNPIAAQNLHDAYPVAPDFSDQPYCMGGEAGVMLSGVPLFNGFDANMRDAAAHEVQDSCNGHPQREGQYHYHSLSKCFKDIGEKTVLGYALDGFPITGPLVAPGKYLITGNLDECHGLTSEIMLDGKPAVTYHYVMTQDFPYSVSCFRGKPARTGPANPPRQQSPQGRMMPQGGPPQGPPGGGPPPKALAACEGKAADSPCNFSSPLGSIGGTCFAPPGRPLACRPQLMHN